MSESNDWITILDVIIGDAIEKNYHEKNYNEYIKMLIEAYELSGKESAEMATIEIDTINEQHNPIKRKIREITKEFPFWPMQIVFPQENGDLLKGKFKLTHGLKTIDGSLYTKKLLELELSIRKVGVFDSDSIFLFNTIGEYCLARKTQKEIGTDGEVWQERYDKAEWTK